MFEEEEGAWNGTDVEGRDEFGWKWMVSFSFLNLLFLFPKSFVLSLILFTTWDAFFSVLHYVGD